MRWPIVIALAVLGCSKSHEADRAPKGSASPPPHITNATPTITTMTIRDFQSQATAAGSAYALKHVRVRGTLDSVTRDGSGCITTVTLKDGDATMQCTLVDPSPVPLHATVTVDGQVSLDTTPPALSHCRVMAPSGPPGPLEPACTQGSAAN
jgi:hypothetical protein